MNSNSRVVSDQRRVLARTIRDAFGGSPSVDRYWDDERKSSIDILSVVDRPWPGATAYGTIGLSEHATGFRQEDNDRSIRVELVGAARSEQAVFPNVVSSCGFYVMNSHLPCHPGAIFRDVVRLYAPATEMSHVLFTPAFPWQETLQTVELPGAVVAWLLVVPISESERVYARDHGADALQSLLEEREADFTDLHRPSVV